jgi:iron complex transport system substrate-binding protein
MTLHGPNTLRTVLLALLLLVASCTTPAPVRDEGAATPQRIISVVPSATEMLLAFGIADRLIAVGDYDQVPAEFGEKPRIGGLLNPNVEKIIEFKPDLVITYGTQESLEQRLSALGIRFHPFVHGNVDQTLGYMQDLGVLVGREQQSAEIVDRIHNAFADVQTNQRKDEPKVLLVHNRGVGMLGAFYSVGARAFQHELIEMAGGKNIFADVDKEVVQPSLEEIISRAPDVIIETLPSRAPDSEIQQRIADWQKLSKVPAVQRKQVYVVSEDYMLVPGPRLDLAARKFSELLRQGRVD